MLEMKAYVAMLIIDPKKKAPLTSTVIAQGGAT
jgi:hypothetical protein